MDEWEGVYIDGTPKRVKALRLRASKLSGEIPEALGNLSELESLSLMFNDDLTGEIPASLGNLSKLESLSLSFNNLTGGVPEALGNLSELESLSLMFNDLTGEIPASLGNLSKLRDLDLSGSGLSGCIPTALKSDDLTSGSRSEVYLDYYAFCDDIPEPLPEPESEFDIDLYFIGLNALAIGRNTTTGRSAGRVSVVRDEIERAVTWWESKITGDVPDESIWNSASWNSCSVEGIIEEEEQTIDDLAVIVRIGTQGPFGASARVCRIRPERLGRLPLLARIDIHQDYLKEVGRFYAYTGPGSIEWCSQHYLLATDGKGCARCGT